MICRVLRRSPGLQLRIAGRQQSWVGSPGPDKQGILQLGTLAELAGVVPELEEQGGAAGRDWRAQRVLWA